MRAFPRRCCFLVFDAQIWRFAGQVERPPDSDGAAGNAEKDLEGRWDEMAPQLSVILEGGGAEIPYGVVPFDATSEVPIDDQK